MSRQGILLESGTNEVEILEFYLGSQGFGVNVAKVQAIVQFQRENLTRLPNAHMSMPGMLLFRNRTIPLIDLACDLNIRPPVDWDGEDAENTPAVDDHGVSLDKRIVLVTEFNRVVNSFLVDGVNRIHRISWQDISPVNPVLAVSSAEFTGSVNIEGHEILIVDLEKIISNIFPEAAMRFSALEELSPFHRPERSEVKVILADDSSAIRNMIHEVLTAGGYEDIRTFNNGRDAYDAIVADCQAAEADGTELGEKLNVVISDIEMPQMDGLTLCRNLKQNLGLQTLPVILFSSLINEQMAAKCQSVGADVWISKPQIAELVTLLDQHCLTAAATEAA